MTVGKNQVRGVLLEFSDSKVLNSLDRLEDYQEQRASSLNEYYRSLTLVYGLDDRPIAQAWAYYMKSQAIEFDSMGESKLSPETGVQNLI